MSIPLLDPKKCTMCKETKPLVDYYYKTSRCKACTIKVVKDRNKKMNAYVSSHAWKRRK